MIIGKNGTDAVRVNGSFTLWGWRFYQQFRRCNKVNCSVCVPKKPGHGPYWFRRGRHFGNGKPIYMGRQLPGAIADALRRWELHRSEMRREIIQTEKRLRSLQRLYNAENLSESDCELLTELGYGGSIWRE